MYFWRLKKNNPIWNYASPFSLRKHFISISMAPLVLHILVLHICRKDPILFYYSVCLKGNSSEFLDIMCFSGVHRLQFLPAAPPTRSNSCCVPSSALSSWGCWRKCLQSAVQIWRCGIIIKNFKGSFFLSTYVGKANHRFSVLPLFDNKL